MHDGGHSLFDPGDAFGGEGEEVVGFAGGIGAEGEGATVVLVGGDLVTLILNPNEEIGLPMSIGVKAAVELKGEDGKGTALDEPGQATEHLPLGSFDVDFAEVHDGIGAEDLIKTDGLHGIWR